MRAEHKIDINCDLGEGYGNDAEVFPWITSCNIACGVHAGDRDQMERTVEAALKYGVQIGAHPSYPDRQNFGRTRMHMSADELKEIIWYQLVTLIDIATKLGAKVNYVKPHGALCNTAADDDVVAQSIIESIQAMDKNLALMGSPGSRMEEIARMHRMRFIAEAFADRGYHQNGRLVSRNEVGAIIEDPERAAKQALSIILRKQVTSIEGVLIPVYAQSICVHGDHPNTPAILRKLDKVLRLNNIQKEAFSPR